MVLGTWEYKDTHWPIRWVRRRSSSIFINRGYVTSFIKSFAAIPGKKFCVGVNRDEFQAGELATPKFEILNLNLAGVNGFLYV